MADEVVVDASVAAKWLLEESGSAQARELALSRTALIAPELIYAEVANVIVKWVRRGLAPRELGPTAIATLDELIGEATSLADLGTRPFELALEHGFSAYDACYLALAEQRGLQVVTADQKLVARARDRGLAGLVASL